MEQFPPNSKSTTRPEEPKHIDRVTSVDPIRRKKSLGKRFKSTFVGGSAKIAVEYMITEVIIPAIQETLIDAFQGGIERLIRGESRPRRAPSGYSNVGHVAYNRMSAPVRSDPPRTLSRRARSRHDFDEIVIPDRREAQEVIERMYDVLSRYDVVTVSDFYAMIGVQSAHTDHKWGWRNLAGTRAVRLGSGGYLLDLPEPEALD